MEGTKPNSSDCGRVTRIDPIWCAYTVTGRYSVHGGARYDPGSSQLLQRLTPGQYLETF